MLRVTFCTAGYRAGWCAGRRGLRREPSLSRRFIMWLMSLAWRALSVSWLVLLIAVRDSEVSLGASCRPAASR